MDMAEYMRVRRATRREKAIEILGGSCDNCGSRDSLQINHTDRFQKKVTLSGKGLDGNWNNILVELKKCNLLCEKHHLEYTRMQYSRGEIEPWNKNKEPIEHGSARAYTEINCRCEPCKYAKRLYRAKSISYCEIVALPVRGSNPRWPAM